jgi:hypothetical protein
MDAAVDKKADYNTRLFSRGIRGWFHRARFKWLHAKLREFRHLPRRVVELGCFDAKTIEYLPNPPLFYHGFDANWERGLDLARERYGDDPTVRLTECATPAEMTASAVFDTAICMETLEHVPPDLVDAYLERMAELTRGLLFITVPNEKRLVFLGKYSVKKGLFIQTYPYTLREIMNATLGKMEHVARNEHKGFDYQKLIASVDRYFDVIDVGGTPFSYLPTCLNFTVGIVAKSKT